MRTDSRLPRKPRIPGPSSGSSSIKINASHRIILQIEGTDEYEDLTPLPLFPIMSEAEKNSTIDLVRIASLQSYNCVFGEHPEI